MTQLCGSHNEVMPCAVCAAIARQQRVKTTEATGVPDTTGLPDELAKEIAGAPAPSFPETPVSPGAITTLVPATGSSEMEKYAAEFAAAERREKSARARMEELEKQMEEANKAYAEALAKKTETKNAMSDYLASLQ